jgi:hypothetical protein
MMKVLKFHLASLVGGLAFSTSDAWAGTTAATGFAVGGSLLLESLSLLVIAACLLAMVRVYTCIRGGGIGRGWFWFILACVVLGIAQLLLFGGRLGLVSIWDGGVWIEALRLVSLVLLLVGVTRFRKQLA